MIELQCPLTPAQTEEFAVGCLLGLLHRCRKPKLTETERDFVRFLARESLKHWAKEQEASR